MTCGPGTVKPIPDKFMDRARRCAEDMSPLTEQMGLDFKTFINEGSLAFYNAPAVALIFLDEAFLPDRMTDVGVFAGYLVIAAAAHGLASCPIGLVRGTMKSERPSEHKGIEVVDSVSRSGNRGPRGSSKRVQVFRAGLNEFVRWVD